MMSSKEEDNLDTLQSLSNDKIISDHRAKNHFIHPFNFLNLVVQDMANKLVIWNCSHIYSIGCTLKGYS